ncbi:hypothetical protein BDR26DRAFT_859929 [Obelidium mucronatum]|nr:hypothetical protein BDR26DRAFT_859929 [Obelidium mucronatum]
MVQIPFGIFTCYCILSTAIVSTAAKPPPPSSILVITAIPPAEEQGIVIPKIIVAPTKTASLNNGAGPAAAVVTPQAPNGANSGSSPAASDDDGFSFSNLLNSLQSQSPCIISCAQQLPGLLIGAFSGNDGSGICSDMPVLQSCNQTCVNSTFFNLIIDECNNLISKTVTLITQRPGSGSAGDRPADPFGSSALRSRFARGVVWILLFALFLLL